MEARNWPPEKVVLRDYLPINNQFAASSNVVDGILENLGRAGSFNNNAENSLVLLPQFCTQGYILKAVWVLFLDLVELDLWV
jgi:hypothetical protein